MKRVTMEICDRCGKEAPSTEMFEIQVSARTFSSPADFESRCGRPGCAPFSDEQIDCAADDHADAVRDGLWEL